MNDKICHYFVMIFQKNHLDVRLEEIENMNK